VKIELASRLRTMLDASGIDNKRPSSVIKKSPGSCAART
jgi:hypothetical protein